MATPFIFVVTQVERKTVMTDIDNWKGVSRMSFDAKVISDIDGEDPYPKYIDVKFIIYGSCIWSDS